MNEKETINFWVDSSLEALKTAESLFKTKRYHHCLFFCHLFLEKILKAIYISHNHTSPPWTHDLLKLAKESSLSLPENFYSELREITRFNIAARYEDIKTVFYKKAGLKVAQKYLSLSKEIYLWLKNTI